MSKERELLHKVLTKLNSYYYEGNVTIKNEIEELLDQPEHFKPDWVSYRQGVEDGINQAKNAQPEQEHVGIVKTIGGYPDNSQHTVELTVRHGDLRDGDLLYKAPPKREPLSEDAIWDALPENPMGCAAFIRGVKFAEKAHGIGGGE